MDAAIITEKKKPKQNLWKALEFLIPLVIVIAAALLLSRKMLIVAGSSMEPTYHSGQILTLTEKLTDLKPDDVIIFDDSEEDRELVKRIVAVPGDTVTVSEHGIFVNGEKIDELNTESDDVVLKTYVLSDSEYFVLGDNRTNSKDSRFFGPVSADRINSKVTGCLF